MSNYSGMIKKGQLNEGELVQLKAAVASRGKNRVVAYVLWALLGLIGGHRFYMNRIGTAIVQLVLSATVVGIMITSLWWLADAILLHRWINEINGELEEELIDEMIAGKSGLEGS